MDRTRAKIFAILIAATAAISCAKPSSEAATAPVAAPAPEAAPGYRKLEPGTGAVGVPIPGELVSLERWVDVSGESLVALSAGPAGLYAGLWKRGPGEGETVGGDGARPPQEFRFPAEPPASGSPHRSGFYGNGAWSGDFDGDGYGELMFVAWVDPTAEPGPIALDLVVMSSRGTYRVGGSSAYDPPGGARVPATGMTDAALSGLDGPVRDEAQKLWSEALFNLAEPKPFQGFEDHLELDGARFAGDKPAWTLVLLPSRMELGLGEGVATISYDSIRSEGSGWVIEGSGRVEAWDHRLRVTITPATATGEAGQEGSASGTERAFAALVEISDGTRLEGGGAFAATTAGAGPR